MAGILAIARASRRAALIVACMLPALLAAASAAFAEPTMAKLLRIRSDPWCPYNCAPGSDHPGFAIEIAQAVFPPHGIAVDYAGAETWEAAIAGLFVGEVDAVVGALPSEAPGAVFPKEALGKSLGALLALRRDTGDLSSLDKLGRRRFAIIAGFDYGDDINALISSRDRALLYTPRPGPGPDMLADMLEAMLTGKADVLYENSNVLRYTLSRHPRADTFRIAQEFDGGSEPGIAFSPKHPRADWLAHAWDEGVARLRASGALAKIMARYGLEAW